MSALRAMGLVSYPWIDGDASDALGFPRSK